MAKHKRIHKGSTAVNLDVKKSMNEDSSTHETTSNDYVKGDEVKTIKEEINEDGSVDDPLSIHEDNENKEEDMYDYD